MELTGNRLIAAERGVVWEHLVCAETLAACIPGCEAFTGTPDSGFEAVVRHKLGPVKATFKGLVTLSNVVTAESYTITGEGMGGMAGFAKGGAHVVLTDAAEGTKLNYAFEAEVGGKLARLGNRIIHGFANRMTEAFFENFQGVVEGLVSPAGEAGDMSKTNGQAI